MFAINSTAKFVATFATALLALTLLAASDVKAGECNSSELSLKTAIAAKFKMPVNDIGICGIYSSKPSANAGYIETTVQFAEGGEIMCTRESQETRVTVKGTCN